VVARLTRTHEAAQPAPWKMGDSAPEFIDTLLQKIVGLEIGITRLTGKFKLSQNKALRDLRTAGETLTAQGEHAVGDAMLALAAARRDPD
jgi:transcriptional regulator